MTHTEAEAKQIRDTIVGGKIRAAFTTPDGGSFGFRVGNGDKEFDVWVDCDPEGNGPGHLNIEEA